MIFYGGEFRVGGFSDYVSVRCVNQFIRRHLGFIHCGVFVLFAEASQLALLTLFEACIMQS